MSDRVQEVWQAVSEVVEAVGLAANERDLLRHWAGCRMRERPAIVFDPRQPSIPMRPSFRVAIEHAARDLLKGVTPS